MTRRERIAHDRSTGSRHPSRLTGQAGPGFAKQRGYRVELRDSSKLYEGKVVGLRGG